MKKYVLFFVMLLSVQMAVAQGMSDQQVMSFIASEVKAGTSQAQIVTKLMQRGVKIDQKTAESITDDYFALGRQLTDDELYIKYGIRVK